MADRRVVAAFLAVVFCVNFYDVEATVQRPNFVLLLMDDVRYALILYITSLIDIMCTFRQI